MSSSSRQWEFIPPKHSGTKKYLQTVKFCCFFLAQSVLPKSLKVGLTNTPTCMHIQFIRCRISISNHFKISCQRQKYSHCFPDFHHPSSHWNPINALDLLRKNFFFLLRCSLKCKAAFAARCILFVPDSGSSSSSSSSPWMFQDPWPTLDALTSALLPFNWTFHSGGGTLRSVCIALSTSRRRKTIKSQEKKTYYLAWAEWSKYPQRPRH